MTTPWSSDFSYAYFKRLIEVVKQRFEIRLLGDGIRAGAGPQLFIRHDIDVSVERALVMGEIEADLGVAATHMFIPTSDMYDLRAEGPRLRKLVDLGHEVALHFDVGEARRASQPGIAELVDEIERQCAIVADLSGRPVRSVSFHRPMPQFLRGDLTVGARTNAYAADLMACYLSDSKGNWRSGEPLPFLATTSAPVVQLLIHPIWWGERHLDAGERLEAFFVEQTAGLELDARDSFDTRLAATLPGARRRDYKGA